MLKLEGSLKGPWVEELRRTWLSSTKMAAGTLVSVDLAGATFADALGRDLLLRMREKGVVLNGGSNFLRQLLEDQNANPEQFHGEGRTK